MDQRSLDGKKWQRYEQESNATKTNSPRVTDSQTDTLHFLGLSESAHSPGIAEMTRGIVFQLFRGGFYALP